MTAHSHGGEYRGGGNGEQNRTYKKGEKVYFEQFFFLFPLASRALSHLTLASFTRTNFS